MSDAEEARKLFSGPCDFVLAASEPSHFLSAQGSPPEVAFIGRSNVGKSSLINALTNRKSLARTSNTPGRTQQIIYFNLGNRLMLVDLPGYGHAKAPDSVQNQWGGLTRTYLMRHPNLRLVILLLDGRHGAMAKDIEMMKLLNTAAVGYQVVLTKSDQVKLAERTQRVTQVQEILKKQAAARPTVFLTSAEDKSGLEELRTLIASFGI